MKSLALLAVVALVAGAPTAAPEAPFDASECLHFHAGPPPSVEAHLADCVRGVRTAGDAAVTAVVHVL